MSAVEKVQTQDTMPVAPLDPIRYEIFYNRLQNCLQEAKDVVRQVSGSVITRDAGEVAEGFYLLNGDSVLMAAGVLLHVNTVSRTIKYMLEQRFGDDVGFHDGDQFLNNDSHIGGAHLADMLVIAPLHHAGRQVGWVGNFTHIPEVGAIDPGYASPRAMEFYHEGICLPCVKIVERGMPRRDVLQMMSRGVRVPRILEMDTRAKIAGNERAKQRILELIEDVGIDFFLAASNRLVEDAERQARARIRDLRPGTYRSRVFCDVIGGSEEGLSVVETEVEVTAVGDLVFRTPVVSPQRRGFNNCALPATEAMWFSLLMNQLFYDLRWNVGTLRATRIEVPEGSMLNCGRTAAVAYGIIGIAQQAMNSLNVALSQALYASGREGDVLSACGNLTGVSWAGHDPFGRPGANMTTDGLAGGVGARVDRDGVDSALFPYNPWSECADVENVEGASPLMYLVRRHTADSGGFGRFRGGNGLESVLVVHGSRAVTVMTRGFGHRVTGAQGLFGGYPPSCGEVRFVHGTDLSARIAAGASLPTGLDDLEQHLGGRHERVMPSSPGRHLVEGDVLAVRYWGGGGLGDPIERAPDLVVKDLREGNTTMRAAHDVYCVAVDADTLEVDEAGTVRLREARRQERLRRGTPGRQYVRDMVDRRRRSEMPEPVRRLFAELSAVSPRFVEQLAFEEAWAEEEPRA